MAVLRRTERAMVRGIGGAKLLEKKRTEYLNKDVEIEVLNCVKLKQNQLLYDKNFSVYNLL